jgi:hypothetical protein
MTEKKRTATISAAEQQLEGWPLPASEVALTLSIRRFVALFWRRVTASEESAEGEFIVLDSFQRYRFVLVT